EHAAAFLVDHGHGAVELRSAVATQRSQHVTGEALRMDTNEHGLVGSNLAQREGDVITAAREAAIEVQIEFSELAGKADFAHFLHQLFSPAAIRDEVRDGDNLETVLLCNL